MKKSGKLLGLLLAMSMIIMMFAGCTTQETALYQALNNTNTQKSFEADQTVNFSVNLKSGGTAEEKQQAMALAMLNNMPVTAHTVSVSESETKAKMYGKVGFGPATMEMWIDADSSGSMPAAKEIFKINPSFDTLIGMAGSDVPKELTKLMAGKQYMVLDTNEIYNDPELKSQMGNIDMTKIQQAAMEYGKKIAEITKNFKLETGTDGIVKDMGEKAITVNGQSVTARDYQVAISDAALKDLVSKNADAILKDGTMVKSIMDATLEYMNNVIDISAPSKAEADKAKTEMLQQFKDFENNLPKYAAEIQKTTGSLNDVKLLGDKGICLDFYVDKDGNVVKQTEDSSYLLDMAKISQLIKQSGMNVNSGIKGSQDMPELTGVYEITVKSTEDIYNINKPLTVTLPTVTKANSFSYMDLIKAAASISGTKPTQPTKPQPKPAAKTVKVTVKKATLYKGYVPQGVITSGKGKITYSKGVANITINGYKVSIKPNAKYITINGKKVALKGVGAVNVKGKIFLSKEALSKIGVILVIK